MIDFISVGQTSKRNKTRLQYLARLVAESLIDIAEHMQDKWDDASPTLKTKVDELEMYVLP